MVTDIQYLLQSATPGIKFLTLHDTVLNRGLGRLKLQVNETILTKTIAKTAA